MEVFASKPGGTVAQTDLGGAGAAAEAMTATAEGRTATARGSGVAGRAAGALGLKLLAGLCSAAVGLGACHRDVDERLGLAEQRGQRAIDAAHLADGGELERAVGGGAAEVAARWKSWRLVESATLTLAAGERHDALEQSWTLEVDPRGATHVLTENSHGYGFETYAVDGSIYARPRHGHFVRRAPEGDEGGSARDGVQGVLAGYLGVLGRFAERRDEGEVTVGGRKARRIRLALARSPARLRDPDPAHAWRHAMKVSELSGVVDVDVETGAPLHAALDAAWVAPGARRAAEGAAASASEVAMKLAFRGDADQIGAVPAIRAPEGALPSLARARPMLDRQTLLDGLVGPGVAPAGER